MKTHRTAIILLAVVSAALVVPLCSADPTKRVIVDSCVLLRTCDVFPGTPYDDRWSDRDAVGDVLVDQPVNLKSVTFDLVADKLVPGETYRIFFDWTGYEPGNPSSIGGCQLVGEVVADPTGHIAWVYTPLLEPRYYTVCVIVNRYRPGQLNRSMLISDANVSFTINNPNQ